MKQAHNKLTPRVIIQAVFFSLILTGQLSSANAGTVEVGTQFTFQGELIDNGSPANGEYDFLFQLFSSSVGGSPVDFVSVEDLSVNDGLISVELDYGDMPFDGDEKYLQINVRLGDSSGSLTPLVPRQRINVTPYAIQAEFTENSSSPWVDVSGGIQYSDNVYVGSAVFSDSLLTSAAPSNVSPFRARIGGSTRFEIQENGGTSIGSFDPAPAQGLFVESDAKQSLSAHGFVKAATNIECASGVNGGSLSYFNNVNDNDFTTSQNGAGGGCVITVPFDISNAFFTVSAYDTGGVNVFETVVASCSPISNNELQCQLQKIGANTAVSNGVVQLAVY
ncbi:hypothetical protein OS175_01615 [Marinicella sp. S1101]|uniref:hypothetical protein n=1 Tax=Marinicella marina TaxID=2996016 RepID=UPI002260DEEC|nr:hypothetical protein [Marinicella marina]MCX7552560.1 hypothetical protein [Marinicella marina]MDJ1139436.1 hypothetical protein [Marinicella marina]